MSDIQNTCRYWTDDASMAFCIAESVTRLGGYNLADIEKNFVKWLSTGFWSSLPHAFDVGNATMDSIADIKKGSLKNGEGKLQGNGSIIRLAPTCILNFGNPNHLILHEISDLTHCSKKFVKPLTLWQMSATVIRLDNKQPSEPFTKRGKWPTIPVGQSKSLGCLLSV